MKRAFTLIEMLVVVAVLVTLMTMVFRLSSIGGDAQARNVTVVRLQRLENCLSGYYAAFGSYPPVKLHGSRDPNLAVGDHGIQTNQRNTWSGNDWDQVEAACRAQPLGCSFPFSSEYSDFIKAKSETMKSLAQSKDPAYKSLWQNESDAAKLAAGFTDGNDGSLLSLRNETDWQNAQVFRFGAMSFLLPRYLVMMGGHKSFFDGSFKQWEGSNTKPCNPLTGERYSSWQELKQDTEGTQSDYAKVKSIPSQAVCARWLPNLEGSCACTHAIELFGVSLRDSSSGVASLDDMSRVPEIFSPDETGYRDQYILDSITMYDGWGHELYYYSPSPFQTYTVWSAGPNGKTFPPWISRTTLNANQKQTAADWTADDIIHMSN